MFDREKFLKKCEELYPIYKKRVRGVPPAFGCVLEGESFCFCVLCEMLGVDVIIESGLCHGASTQMFAKYFLGTSMEIYTIDLEVMDETKKALEEYPNIKDILAGDGASIVPEVISSVEKSKKIAVFIDGPKSEEQLELAKAVINDVEFVGLHDVGQDFSDWAYAGTYEKFMEWEDAQFITTELWYSSRYSHMNETQLLWLRGEPNTGWPQRNDGYDCERHNPILEKVTPKGFGLGIAMKRTLA